MSDFTLTFERGKAKLDQDPRRFLLYCSAPLIRSIAISVRPSPHRTKISLHLACNKCGGFMARKRINPEDMESVVQCVSCSSPWLYGMPLVGSITQQITTKARNSSIVEEWFERAGADPLSSSIYVSQVIEYLWSTND